MNPLVESWLKEDETILPVLLNIAAQLYRENGLKEIKYKNHTFVKGDLIFSDEIYDQLKELCDFEEPKMNAQNRPKVKQLYEFGTLEKITHDSFTTYMNRVEKIPQFIVLPKYDGIGLRIYYGQIFLTRFDKEYGLDISYKCRKLLPEFDFSKTILRGELMTLVDHEKSTNRRAYVSGQVASMEVLADDVVFICYEYLKLDENGNIIPQTTQEMLKSIKEAFGFEHKSMIVQHEDLSYNLMKKFASEIPEQYKTDGIVIRPDDSANSFENLTKPKFQVAVKFEQPQTKAVVKELTWSVGQGGFLAPTIWLQEPVTIDGTQIEKATGVNFNFLYDQNIYPGSTCNVSLKVVPRIIGIALPTLSKTQFSQHIKPICCPQCEGPIEVLNDSVDRYKCRDYYKKCFKRVAITRAVKILQIKKVGKVLIDKIAEDDEIGFGVWLNQYEYTNKQLFLILSEGLGESKLEKTYSIQKLKELIQQYNLNQATLLKDEAVK